MIVEREMEANRRSATVTGCPQTVLFVVDHLPVGGAERFLLNLVKGIDRRRIEPMVVSMGSEQDPLYPALAADALSYVVPRRWRYDFSPARKIADIIRRHGTATVFCFGFFTAFFVRRAVKDVQWPVRLILSLHSTVPRDLKAVLQTHAYVHMLGPSDEIVTVCDYQRAYLSARFGIDLSRMHTIYNGVDTRAWDLAAPGFDRRAARRAIGVPEDAIVVLNVAAFRKEKGHTLMLTAFRRLLERRPDLPMVLVLVGGGNPRLEARLRGLASSRGIADRMIFAGSQSDVRPFYWTADMFTLGSTRETFSLAALEAMSTGLPCVLSDIGGARELVAGAEYGCVVPTNSADALAVAWAAVADNLKNYSHAAIRDRVVKNFDLHGCLENYSTLLLSHPAMSTIPPVASDREEIQKRDALSRAT